MFIFTHVNKHNEVPAQLCSNCHEKYFSKKTIFPLTDNRLRIELEMSVMESPS
jgi:hypothetical protein